MPKDETRAPINPLLEQAIDEEVQATAGKCAPEEQNAFKQILLNVLTSGMTIMQAIGFPPAQLEVIYSYAIDLYKSGKYEEAAGLFFFLGQMNPKDPRYSFGMAAVFHKTKRYFEATTYYLASALHDPSNPLPYFHAGDCFQQLHKPEAAIIMLDRALSVAGDAPQHEKLVQQASAWRESIEQAAALENQNAPKQEAQVN